MIWLIVQQGENSSTDFFVAPHLIKQGVRVIYADLHESPSNYDSYKIDGVVFCRYTSKDWLSWVSRNRASFNSICYFIDDDIFSKSAIKGQPREYRSKLRKYAQRFESKLLTLLTEFWVSTEVLAILYINWPDVKILQHCNPHPPNRRKTVFYHGSASHNLEFDWLMPLFERLDIERKDIHLELIGPRETRNRYRHIKSLTVLHPMKWPAYKALIASGKRDIGLAPLCESLFNQTRSPTKFYDITRAGGVGIYADHPVYRDSIKNEVTGLLLPMETDEWFSWITKLLDDESIHSRILRNATISIE